MKTSPLQAAVWSLFLGSGLVALCAFAGPSVVGEMIFARNTQPSPQSPAGPTSIDPTAIAKAEDPRVFHEVVANSEHLGGSLAPRLAAGPRVPVGPRAPRVAAVKGGFPILSGVPRVAENPVPQPIDDPGVPPIPLTDPPKATLTPGPRYRDREEIAMLKKQIDELRKARAGEDNRRDLELLRMQIVRDLQRDRDLRDLRNDIRSLKNQPPTRTSKLPVPELPVPKSPVKPKLVPAPASSGVPRFNLKIADAQLRDVLESLGKVAGVNIVIGNGVEGKVSTDLSDVTIEEAFDAVLSTGGYKRIREGNLLFILTAQDAQKRKLLSRQIVTKIYRPRYVAVRELQTLLQPMLSQGTGKLAVTTPAQQGLEATPTEGGGDALSQTDALLVMDYPEIIAQVDKVVAEVDVPPMQVAIEAKILRVRLDDSMRFGVNFALLNRAGQNLVTVGNGQLLNGASGIPGGPKTGIVPATGQFLAEAAGLKYGFLRGDMSLFIDALETISDTSLIASPQLRVLNKQKAQLIIGRRVSYVTRTFQNNQTIESVNFLDAGTRLVLRPYVTRDGMVRMEVHPERSTATRNPQTQLPDLETTEVTTNVMVRDGSTVIIGGLIEEETEESYDRVPVLGSLPWVGKIFRNKDESIVRSELIVLITPRIVQEPEDAIEGDAVQREHEQRATNFRNNLMAFNRRNLARMEYDRAARYFHRGDLLKARTHIDRAMTHSKNDIKILRLRNRIYETIRSRRRGFFSKTPPPPEPLPEPNIEPTPLPDLVPPVIEVERPRVRPGRIRPASFSQPARRRERTPLAGGAQLWD